MNKRDWKLIAASVTLVGVIISLFGKMFEPVRPVFEKEPWYGSLADNVGWFILLIAPIFYIWLDRSNLSPKLFLPKKDD